MTDLERILRTTIADRDLQLRIKEKELKTAHDTIEELKEKIEDDAESTVDNKKLLESYADATVSKKLDSQLQYNSKLACRDQLIAGTVKHVIESKTLRQLHTDQNKIITNLRNLIIDRDAEIAKLKKTHIEERDHLSGAIKGERERKAQLAKEIHNLCTERNRLRDSNAEHKNNASHFSKELMTLKAAHANLNSKFVEVLLENRKLNQG